MVAFRPILAFASKWTRKLALLGVAGASIIAVDSLQEYAIGIALLVLALVVFTAWVYDWKGIEGKRVLTVVSKGILWTLTAFILILLAIVYIRLKGPKPWSNIETLDKVVVRLIGDVGYIYSITPWRVLASFAAGCIITALIIWFQRKTESKALSGQQGDIAPEIQEDTVSLECVATRPTKVGVAEKGGWTKPGKRPLNAVTLEFKNVTDYILYPLIARIAFYRSDGQFCFQVNKAEWLEAGRVREVLLGVGATRELLLLWQLSDKDTYASGNNDRVDLGSCGNVVRAVVTFIGGRNESHIGEFEFEVTLNPLSIKGKSEASRKSAARRDEWLRRVAETDKESIANLVRIAGIRYEPDFANAFIDYRFAVLNNSIYDLEIDPRIFSGNILYGPDHITLHYEPKIMSDQPIFCGGRNGTGFVIRQSVREEEISRWFKETDNTLILFGALRIRMTGTERFPEIGETWLNTQHALETKDIIWRGNDAESVFRFTEEEWRLLALSNNQEVAELQSEIRSLKDKLELATALPVSIVPQIDDDFSSLIFDVKLEVEPEGLAPRVYSGFAGTTGQYKPLMSFAMWFDPEVTGLSLTYQGFFEDGSSSDFQDEGGVVSAVDGNGKKLEIRGFTVKLVGPEAQKYDVVYTAHMRGTGNLERNFKNGEFCGTHDRAVEGMKVVVCRRGIKVPPLL